jgi:hypothetical protein
MQRRNELFNRPYTVADRVDSHDRTLRKIELTLSAGAVRDMRAGG